MHPKVIKGVMDDDKEIARLERAEQWFLGEAKALFESQ
jgi:hypothetical protein